MRKGIRQEQASNQTEQNGYVAYYRVSTDKQGASGLGLEAQQEAAQRVARTTAILAEFTEVETAKKNHAVNRPQLLAAIDAVMSENSSARLQWLRQLHETSRGRHRR